MTAGGTYETLTLVPIVVGAILFGPGAGAGLGFVFGLVCLIAGVTGADQFTYLLWTASPFWLIVVCVGKAVLCGLCAGLAAKALEKKQTLSCIAAALVAPVVNTGVFAVGMLTVFRPILAQYAGGTDVVPYLFVAFIGVNFLVEFAVNAVLSAAKKFLRRRRRNFFNVSGLRSAPAGRRRWAGGAGR